MFFGAEKKNCGNGDTHSLVLGFFNRRKTQGCLFGAEKTPAGSTRTHTLVWGGGPVSNPVPPGCVVRVLTHWAICAPFRWRVPSKGAPFPTLEPIGVHFFGTETFVF